MSIRFDSQSCVNELRKVLIDDMKMLQEELLAESRQGMLTGEGKESLHEEEIIALADFVSVSIAGGAWAAMDEFGTGSLMDNSNEALDAYKNSNMWNPARTDNKIRSRPDTPGQFDIFGNPVRGHGKGGFDLESLGGIYSPAPPSRAIRTAARWMRNTRFKEKIKKTIKHFPFHKFFIVDEK